MSGEREGKYGTFLDENKKADISRCFCRVGFNISKGQHIIGPTPVVQKCHKIDKYSVAHITVPLQHFFLLYPFFPNVHILPLQKITTYMSTFLEADNWMEAHYQALKLYMKLDFLLLIPSHVPT